MCVLTEHDRFAARRRSQCPRASARLSAAAAAALAHRVSRCLIIVVGRFEIVGIFYHFFFVFCLYYCSVRIVPFDVNDERLFRFPLATTEKNR